MTAISSVNQPSDPYLNAVVGSSRWASGSITYSFPMTAVMYEVPYGGSNEPLRNFGALSSTQQTAARMALSQYSAVANLTFTERTLTDAPSATIRLAMSDAPNTAWAYLPSTTSMGGDVWFNKSGGQYNNPAVGNYAYATFMHELGHALGLEHPHENGMPADRDSLEYTVMTYRSYVGGSTTTGYVNETWGFPQTLMMYDIAAVQYLYGANFTTNSGNTTYSWSPTTGQEFINGVAQTAPGANKILMTLWDGGGTDTYDFSNYSTNLNVDLRPGQGTTMSAAQLAKIYYGGSQVAHFNVANSLQYNGDARSLIENANGGSGNDIIVGNDANNVIRGNGGNDAIYGGAGTDTVIFTGTISQYSISQTGSGYTITDLVSGRDGTDTVYQVENFQFSDTTRTSSTVVAPDAYFTSPQLVLASYGSSAGGWTSYDTLPRVVGDVNGDGRDDIVAFGNDRVYVSLGQSNGTFGAMQTGVTGYGPGAGGWSSNNSYPRTVADVNGDGRADIVAFGYDRVYVSLGQSNGTFGAMQTGVTGYGPGAGGWSKNDAYPRTLADVNGDGRADIVAFGNDRVYVSLGQTNGTFGATQTGVTGYGPGAGGWSTFDLYPRTLGDVNGDGRADIVAFGYDRTYVSLGQSNGTFGTMQTGVMAFGTSSGWTSFGQYPRVLGDINGDGRDDIIGFGQTGASISLGQSNGTFSAPISSIQAFSYGSGWTSFDGSPRTVGDINGDGRADIIGFDASGVIVALSRATRSAAGTAAGSGTASTPAAASAAANADSFDYCAAPKAPADTVPANSAGLHDSAGASTDTESLLAGYDATENYPLWHHDVGPDFIA